MAATMKTSALSKKDLKDLVDKAFLQLETWAGAVPFFGALLAGQIASAQVAVDNNFDLIYAQLVATEEFSADSLIRAVEIYVPQAAGFLEIARPIIDAWIESQLSAAAS